jgi:hypothetical protein
MKRRTMLGLAATALAGCAPDPTKSAPEQPAVAGVRARKKMKKPADKNVYNFDWGTTAYEIDDMHKAQMLALTMLIINGSTSDSSIDPTAGKRNFALIYNTADQKDLPKDHPMADVNPMIYTQTRNYVRDDPRTKSAKLYAAAMILKDFANAGLKGVVPKVKSAQADDPYTNPDECPCVTDLTYYDCPPVDPLL